MLTYDDDGNAEGIPARVRDDDNTISIEFNAEPWFDWASQDEIVDLMEEAWSDCSLADDVLAVAHNAGDEDVDHFLWFVDKRNTGYVVTINGKLALKWLEARRPDVWTAIQLKQAQDA